MNRNAESPQIQLPSFDLQGRCAVVTGASAGIGQAIAEAFAKAGASLALVSRDPGRLAKIAERAEANGSYTTLHKADVRYTDQITHLANEVLEMHEQVNILVNSAGAPISRLAVDVQEEEWDRVIDTGLKGVFFCCTAFGKAMIEQGNGKIINLSSTYAESVRPTQSVYSIAKGGLSMLTRALALEWAQYGVLVNALAPTLTDTPTRHHIVANEASRKRVEA